jgi:site-specific DNA-cytosine methylase
LGYFVPEPQIVNAKEFGVPQNRERIYIVGFRNDLDVTLKGRAFRSNLFVRSSQKGFPLQTLTQNVA